MPKPTPGTVIMATVATGEDTEATIDPMATMDTMVMEDTGVTMVDTMADHTDMVTMARDLLTKLPLLNLAPTPTPKPTPGMVTTVMVTTGLTVMVTMVLDTVVTTGDKKW